MHVTVKIESRKCTAMTLHGENFSTFFGEGRESVEVRLRTSNIPLTYEKEPFLGSTDSRQRSVSVTAMQTRSKEQSTTDTSTALHAA